MPAYVTLPGTSGNYFSTPDVNLLDADTANQAQSKPFTTGEIRCTGTDAGTDSDGWGATLVTIDSVAANPRVMSQGLTIPLPGAALAAGVLVTADAGNAGTAHQLSLTIKTDTTTKGITPSTIAPGETAWLSGTRSDYTGTQITEIWIEFSTAADLAVGDKFTVSQYIVTDGAGAPSDFTPSLRIVGDLEAEWKVALDDYTPTGHQTILDTQSSNDGYRIRHLTSDSIDIIHGNGSSPREQTSSATGLSDGSAHVFKVTVDVSTGAVVYYIDGVQHDTDTMTTGAASPSGSDLYVGATNSDSLHLDGDLYYVIVRDGIDGPIVAKFDADDWVGI